MIKFVQSDDAESRLILSFREKAPLAGSAFNREFAEVHRGAAFLKRSQDM